MHHQRPKRTRAALPLLGAACCVLAGCMQNYDEAVPFTALETSRIPAPAGAPVDSCWAREVTPAVIESIPERVMVAPRSYSVDGTTEYPAQYTTVFRSQIVEPRQVLEFETVCSDALTPEFIASLQRALQVRAYYFHEITGAFDPPTDAALRAYQTSRGQSTGLLTIETARDFGLAPALFDDAG